MNNILIYSPCMRGCGRGVEFHSHEVAPPSHYCRAWCACLGYCSVRGKKTCMVNHMWDMMRFKGVYRYNGSPIKGPPQTPRSLSLSEACLVANSCSFSCIYIYTRIMYMYIVYKSLGIDDEVIHSFDSLSDSFIWCVLWVLRDGSSWVN